MYSTCRFKALTTLASAIALAGIPASLAFRDSNREVAIVDPALAKLGIQDARELSAAHRRRCRSLRLGHGGRDRQTGE